MPKWRNWQTRTFEGRVRQLVGVRVPPSAPSSLFSITYSFYVHYVLYAQPCKSFIRAIYFFELIPHVGLEGEVRMSSQEKRAR